MAARILFPEDLDCYSYSIIGLYDFDFWTVLVTSGDSQRVTRATVKRATCFTTLLQKELKSDVGRQERIISLLCAFNHPRSNVQIPCIACLPCIFNLSGVSIEAISTTWFDARLFWFNKGNKKCNIRYVSTFTHFACKTRCTFFSTVLPYLRIIEQRLPLSPLSPGKPWNP